jgi:LysR family transcriptional regulator, cell division regulator
LQFPFLELAKTLHVSRAAERLGISQPTLSHFLKRLENESVAGNIRLGCHTAVAQYILPQVLPILLKEYQALGIQLQHGLSRHITEGVVSERLEVGLVVNPSPLPDLVIKEITKDWVSFWKSTLIKNSDVLIYDPSLLQAQDLLKKLSKKGINFKRKIESSSLEVISQMVIAGTGYGILPERVIQAFGTDSASMMKEAPLFQDGICLVFKPKFRKLKRGQVFLEYFSRL